MRGRKKNVLNINLQHNRTDRSTSTPNKKKMNGTPPDPKKQAAVSIMSLPPEVLNNIMFKLSAMDVISFGSTCCYFYELSSDQHVWKRLYLRNFTAPALSKDKIDWRRLTILKMSQGLVLQHLKRSFGRARTQKSVVVQTFNSPLVLGFRRVVPIREFALLWDYNGTLFVTPNGSSRWTGHFNCSVLCYNAKEFAVDPNWNISHRRYIYVLLTLESSGNTPVSAESPESNPHVMRDVVDVFHWDTHQRVLRLYLYPDLSFTQIRLSGSQRDRTLVLLTDEGKVHSMHLNENQLRNSHNYTMEMILNTGCSQLPELPVKELYTSPKSIVYIMVDGSVYVEVHSPGAYRQLFGTYAGFNPIGGEMILPLELPCKVVKCSIGHNHISLLDEYGRIFMQGCNRHGQLGTGDKIDRGTPTQVAVSMAAVDVWCGLNHTLLLLEAECGEKQVQGCGCGSQGRLPGYPKDSTVFVRLNVQAPSTASSLCSSKKCLYLACGHDTAKPPTYCNTAETTDQGDETLNTHLTQMKRCVETNKQVMMLQRTVRQHMTGLSPAHKSFLDSALAIILNGEGRTTAPA